MAGVRVRFLCLLLLLLAGSAVTTRPAGNPREAETVLDEDSDSDIESKDPRHDPELNEALGKFIVLISKYRVVIVGKRGCELTDRVKAAFAVLKERPHFMDLAWMRPDEQWLVRSALKRWLGYWITPQVFVDGKHYGGAEVLLDNYKSGLLAQHLNEKDSEL